MKSSHIPGLPPAMMTRWRRRRLCVLERDGFPAGPAVLRAIDGAGARLECPIVPALGETVVIAHPEAGRIQGRIAATLDGEIRVAFARDTAAIAFALGVIAADMSNPA